MSFDNHILAEHPALPTFEYMHVCNDCDTAVMAPSLQYGVFYLRGDKCIMQSPDLDNETKQKICDLNEQPAFSVSSFIFDRLFGNNDNQSSSSSSSHSLTNFRCLEMPSLEKSFLSFENLEYDDYYGISGCLLVYGKNVNHEYSFMVLLNLDDLIPLEAVLLNNISLLKDLVNEPKVQRTFNITAEVYEYLYGVEYIQLYARSLIKPQDE